MESFSSIFKVTENTVFMVIDTLEHNDSRIRGRNFLYSDGNLSSPIPNIAGLILNSSVYLLIILIFFIGA